MLRSDHDIVACLYDLSNGETNGMLLNDLFDHGLGYLALVRDCGEASPWEKPRRESCYDQHPKWRHLVGDTKL